MNKPERLALAENIIIDRKMIKTEIDKFNEIFGGSDTLFAGTYYQIQPSEEEFKWIDYLHMEDNKLRRKMEELLDVRSLTLKSMK